MRLRDYRYDWRLGADGLAQPDPTTRENGYYDKLSSLIETSFEKNGRKKVHIISHSLGGPGALVNCTSFRKFELLHLLLKVVLAFLNMKGASWQAKFIQSFIPLSGPFAGSTVMTKSLVSGDTFGIPLVPADYLRPVQCSASSGTWLMSIG